MCACAQIRNLWEILSGQHRTNAGDEFVNGIKSNEAEWAAVLGKTLCPIFLPEDASAVGYEVECRVPGQGVAATGTKAETLRKAVQYTLCTTKGCISTVG